jgi:hypothetical protein
LADKRGSRGGGRHRQGRKQSRPTQKDFRQVEHSAQSHYHLPRHILQLRNNRLATALFVVLSLLLSQLALAGTSACSRRDVETVAAMMEAG